MKNLLLAILLLFTSTAFSQTDIYLDIDHFLGSNSFQFGTAAQNNLGNDFNVSRMQYYIAEITLVHDGGQETVVTDHWILVDGADPVKEMLGNYSITDLESIKFGVGVEDEYNHLDPATYANTHPLAPKFPSMHWGWSAGYRFVAMEGKGGAALDQTYELHALGDKNYFTVSIPVNEGVSGSEYHISLKADYEEALSGINVSSGLIVHGETGAAQTILSNFQTKVFSIYTPTGIKNASLEQNVISVFPNPSNGEVVTISGLKYRNATYVISDLTGKEISRHQNNGGNVTVSIANSGMYMVSVYNGNELVSIEKLIVK